MVDRPSNTYDGERKNFEIQASNDASFATYEVLAAVGNEPFPNDSTWQLNVTNTGKFRYIRYAKPAISYAFVSELRVLGNAVPEKYTIGGKVSDGNQPVADATVNLYSYDNKSEVIGTATTAADGTYNIADKCIAGKYIVKVEKQRYSGSSVLYVPYAAVTDANINAAWESSSTPTVEEKTTTVDNTVGTTKTTKEGDKTVTTVLVDGNKVNEILKNTEKNPVVSIQISNNADIKLASIDGQTIKSMEDKEAVLEIKAENVTYTLPASQININDISKQLGKEISLKDIKVDIKISEPLENTTQIIENTAEKNGYQVVVKPVEFEITCAIGTKKVEVSKFNAYVQRTVAIPAGIDPSKITTGVVLNADGTFSHVPTTIIKIDWV